MFTVYVVLTFMSLTSANNLNNIDIDEYTKLINDRIESAKNYELPKNAYRFRASTNSIEDFGKFDFIIVGGGSTGAVLANRLSENKHFQILLLEAGEFPGKVENVSQMSVYNQQSKFNWGYTTTPQKTACLGMIDRVCPVPRGCGLGGSSLLNLVLYTRGNPIDYDLWESQGNPGWSYNNVLPFFKKSEDFHKNIEDITVDEDIHGYGGPLNVEYHKPGEIVQAFLEANNELGYKSIDPNGKNTLGCSPTPFNTKNGVRWHTENAFIKPILHRRNLKILSGSFVTKILISKNKTKGVQFTYQRKTFIAKVKKEVILSAGVISTPQILMLSGIGPKTHLESFGINVVRDLPVGSQLLDHNAYWGLVFTSNVSIENSSIKEQVKQFADGYGPLTINTQGMCFYQTKLEKIKNFTDLELVLIPPVTNDPIFTPKNFRWKQEIFNSIWGRSDPHRTFNLIILNLHSKSTGDVKLHSDNPFDYPLINLNFISDKNDRDINTLYEGIQLALSLVNTTAFQKINVKLDIEPIQACKNYKFLSKDYWMCSLRQLTFDLYHPIGTCPMGPKSDQKAVVDSELRVYGVRNLRIADASIIPFTLSGHPAAACMMIGEKLAHTLLEEYSK